MSNPTLMKKSKHHRKPKSKGGKGVGRKNLFTTTVGKHRAYHTLFSNWDVPEIVRELNRWIDPDWKVIAVRRKE